MWPVNPSWITLRVCADLHWTVTVGCPKCRYSTTLHGEKMGLGKLADVPIEKLLQQGAFKCRKVERGCDGTPANRAVVECIDVGMSKTVAKWEK